MGILSQRTEPFFLSRLRYFTARLPDTEIFLIHFSIDFVKYRHVPNMFIPKSPVMENKGFLPPHIFFIFFQAPVPKRLVGSSIEGNFRHKKQRCQHTLGLLPVA